MSKRLAKVAQELNVGIPTIVEFLNHKGLPIENKATSMVTEEMENILNKEFIRDLPELRGLKILGRIDVSKIVMTPEKKYRRRASHTTIGNRPILKKEIGKREEPVQVPPAASPESLFRREDIFKQASPFKKESDAPSKKEDAKPVKEGQKSLLSTFEVQNYRSLKQLKLDGLKRVNLITGKNNTGKSSLLEALSIWAVRGRFYRLLEVMSERNELLEILKNGNGFYKKASSQDVEKIVKEYEPLFFERKIDYSGQDAISIIADNKEEIQLRFVKYIFEGLEKKMVGDEAEEFNIGFRVAYSNGKKDSKSPTSRHLILSDEVLLRRKVASYPKWLPMNDYQYLGTQHPDKEASQEQLSKIALTDMEDELVVMLKEVEKSIQRIGFSGEKKDNQIYVRLEGYKEPVLLTSMGDGMSRITAIMLALANSKNGFLLIDEFENGLHWTVQERLWEVVFRLSKQLNVQVFATTHSDDCIRAFSNVMSKSFPDEGALIRLDNKNGVISPTFYSPEELAIATENLIETRGL